MSASKTIKDLGLPSLQYVANKIGRHPNLLQDWYKNYPELFNAVVLGVESQFNKSKPKTIQINRINSNEILDSAQTKKLAVALNGFIDGADIEDY